MSEYYLTRDELYHHGIKGQKWGIRQYQNPDGSLTPAGRQRYGYSSGSESYKKGLKEATIQGGLIGRAIYKHKNKDAAAKYRQETAAIKARKKEDAEQDKKNTVKKYIDAEAKAWKSTQKMQANEAKIREQMNNVSKNEQRQISKTGKASTKAGKELVKQLEKHLDLRNKSQKAWEKAGAAYKETGKNIFERSSTISKYKTAALALLDNHPEDHGINPRAKENRVQREAYEDAYGKTTGSIRKQIDYQNKYGPNI